MSLWVDEFSLHQAPESSYQFFSACIYILIYIHEYVGNKLLSFYPRFLNHFERYLEMDSPKWLLLLPLLFAGETKPGLPDGIFSNTKSKFE
jgi:hypothetical protein